METFRREDVQQSTFFFVCLRVVDSAFGISSACPRNARVGMYSSDGLIDSKSARDFNCRVLNMRLNVQVCVLAEELEFVSTFHGRTIADGDCDCTRQDKSKVEE